MKTGSLGILSLTMPLILVGCASSDPVVKDYKMMQSVYKQQSAKDQQTISDLRRELDAAERDLKAAEATRAA